MSQSPSKALSVHPPSGGNLNAISRGSTMLGSRAEGPEPVEERLRSGIVPASSATITMP
jgi:hypothetical protein